MEASQNKVNHPSGVIAWLEKRRKEKRYEIASHETSENCTRVRLEISPGACGWRKDRPASLFIAWEFGPEWPDEQGSLLAEISVGPALNSRGERLGLWERKIYALLKGFPNLKGKQFTTAFPKSTFLSKGIPVDVYGVGENDLILSAKLDIHRLRPEFNEETTTGLLMEANEGCYAIPEAVLAGLLDTDHPTIGFQFDLYRKSTASSKTAAAGAPSKKRKRPTNARSARDSDSEPDYQPRRRRGRRQSSVIDLSSPDRDVKPTLALADGEARKHEDQLAMLEELEREEMELEKEAARKIQEKRDRIQKLKEALAK